MKKFPPFIILTLFSIGAVSISAQQAAAHIARDGDKLHPGLSLSTDLILNIDNSTRTVLLNPDAVIFKESLDASAYIDGDTISYVQSATKHRFIYRNDTLSYLGFENRATEYTLATPANVVCFPLQDGVTICVTWTGQILHHGCMLLKRMAGISTSRIEEGWTLTDGTDTIPSASRLIWTLDMAYADTDSVDTSMPDSIASAIISDMRVNVHDALSERLVTERSLWFTEDARYPILTDTRVSRITLPGHADADTVPISLLAMYYPPSFQYSDTGEDRSAMPRRQTGSGDNLTFDSGDIEESTLDIGEPSVSGSMLTVQLSSEYSTDATLTVFTDSGIRLTDPVTVTVGPMPQSYGIPIPSGWSGVVLLRVEAGDASYTRKAII